MGDEAITLKKNEIAFHQPMEFHDVHATGKSAPNLLVVSFECNDDIMEHFRHRVFQVDEIEKTYLANILSDSKKVFNSGMDDPFAFRMKLRPTQEPGAKQSILLNLELFLLHLFRRTSASSPGQAMSKISTIQKENIQFMYIEEYMRDNLTRRLTLEQICHDNHISRSQLMALFKKKTGYSVIEHFNRIKIEEAKAIIRRTDMSFTQISESLGYSSIYYFSRQFHRLSGMSPSEYANSIQALSVYHE